MDFFFLGIMGEEKKQDNIVIRILEWNYTALYNLKFIFQYSTHRSILI